MQKIFLVGATSAIAEQCARIWLAESPKELVLLGRDRIKTERVAKDLQVRSPASSISIGIMDFTDPSQIHEWVSHECVNGSPDIVLIAHGSLPHQEDCQKSLKLTNSTLMLNGISPVLFAEALVEHMERNNKGTLAIVGSVAGDRGRKSNYVYGSAKGLVARYAQGLQHRLAKSGVKVILIKPGPTDTPMTAHLRQTGVKLAPVETVARDIIKAVAIGQEEVYTPKKWKILMMAVQHLPRIIFNKLDI